MILLSSNVIYLYSHYPILYLLSLIKLLEHRSILIYKIFNLKWSFPLQIAMTVIFFYQPFSKASLHILSQALLSVLNLKMQLLTEVFDSLFRITDVYFSIFYTFYKTSIVKELAFMYHQNQNNPVSSEEIIF